MSDQTEPKQPDPLAEAQAVLAKAQSDNLQAGAHELEEVLQRRGLQIVAEPGLTRDGRVGARWFLAVAPKREGP